MKEDFNQQQIARATKAGQIASHDEGGPESDLNAVMGLPAVYDGSHLHDRAFGSSEPISALDEWKAKSGGGR